MRSENRTGKEEKANGKGVGGVVIEKWEGVQATEKGRKFE